MTEATRQFHAIQNAQGVPCDTGTNDTGPTALLDMLDAHTDTETYRIFEAAPSIREAQDAWRTGASAAALATGIHGAAGYESAYDLSAAIIASARDAAARLLARHNNR